jgi:gamma-glutamylcyclotransferase
MDSHHEQVMKARDAVQDAPERFYFGYGTILDRAAFEEWRAEHGYRFFELPPGEMAEALDVALTFDFPSRWWGGRVAGLMDRPGERVFGHLFRIPGKDWPIIQHKEGAVTGMCIERPVRVHAASTGELLATAFTTNPSRSSLEGPVSQRFLEALGRGGRAAGLPETYLASLRSAG